MRVSGRPTQRAASICPLGNGIEAGTENLSKIGAAIDYEAQNASLNRGEHQPDIGATIIEDEQLDHERRAADDLHIDIDHPTNDARAPAVEAGKEKADDHAADGSSQPAQDGDAKTVEQGGSVSDKKFCFHDALLSDLQFLFDQAATDGQNPVDHEIYESRGDVDFQGSVGLTSDILGNTRQFANADNRGQ